MFETNTSQGTKDYFTVQMYLVDHVTSVALSDSQVEVIRLHLHQHRGWVDNSSFFHLDYNYVLHQGRRSAVAPSRLPSTQFSPLLVHHDWHGLLYERSNWDDYCLRASPRCNTRNVAVRPIQHVTFSYTLKCRQVYVTPTHTIIQQQIL